MLGNSGDGETFQIWSNVQFTSKANGLIGHQLWLCTLQDRGHIRTLLVGQTDVHWSI